MIHLHDQGLLEARPNTICYTAVINCCAYTLEKHCADEVDRRAALRIAIQTFKELEQLSYAKPNEVTYSSLLTALRNLLPPSDSRSAAIQTVFQSAATKGYVDPLVVQRVKSALPPDQLNNLLPACLASANDDDKGSVRFDRIPREWCRNVNADKYR